MRSVAPRAFPIEEFKVKINPNQKIGEGAYGVVYRGRLTRPAQGNEKKFSVPVAIKVFRSADELDDDPLIFGWDEKQGLFTNKSWFLSPPRVTLDHYKKVLSVLTKLREEYRRKKSKLLVFPRQAILPGNPDHPQPLLRVPHLVSELFLKPGEKEYNVPFQPYYPYDYEEYFKRTPSKEHDLAESFIRKDLLSRGLSLIQSRFGLKHFRAATDVVLKLAERGIPAAPDLFGAIETKNGARIVIRDPDELAAGLYQIESGNETPIIDVAQYTKHSCYLLPEKDRIKEIARLRLKIERSKKMPENFRRIFLKYLK